MRDRHPPYGVTVLNRIYAREFLSQLHGTLQAVRHEGFHVAGVVEEAGKRQRQILVAVKLRRLIRQADALFQRRYSGIAG